MHTSNTHPRRKRKKKERKRRNPPKLSNKKERKMFTKTANQRRLGKDARGGPGQSNNNKPNIGQCKKHPKHKQAPGVCALCLSEKLSQYQSTSSSSCSTGTVALMGCVGSTSSLDSYDSSSSSSSPSSYASPVLHSYRFSTREGNYNGSLSLLFNGKSNVLTKSRSLPFVQKMRSRENKFSDDDVHKNVNKKMKKKKTGGFLSKLIHPRRKRMDEEALMHSRTLRDTAV